MNWLTLGSSSAVAALLMARRKKLAICMGLLTPTFQALRHR
ncbi:MAG: hypothetical protein WD696_17955 [Bryobacteraceae bacterium]